MNLNKKQVGALLKVVGKDTSRDILTNVYIDEWRGRTVLVATNGYILTALNLDKEDAAELVGRLIRRSAIEKWYKLATGKNRLTTEELVKVSADDYAENGSYASGNYPKWQGVFPVVEKNARAIDEIAFNAEFAKVLQELDDSEGLIWQLHGQLGAMLADTDKGAYLLMPKKV